MKNRVLVTGGTGYVAGWTILELLRRGHVVRATVRNPDRAGPLRAMIAAQVDYGDRLQILAADLLSDGGWEEAVSGCSAVLHIASPMGAAGDADTLIAAATGGVVRVLGAAVRAGVPRVVMTSSTAACTPAGPLDRAIDENDWTDPDQPGLAVYRKSKVLAERAAWDLVRGQTATRLTTLLPGAIFGPVLTREGLGSVGIIQRLLNGQPPALPRLGFNIVDVRDLAHLHIRAMESPEAAGERFIVMGEALWFADVARILRDRLGERAAGVTTADLPDAVARELATTNAEMRELLPLLGRTQPFSTEKARRMLGFSPRPAADTLADCGASLLD